MNFYNDLLLVEQPSSIKPPGFGDVVQVTLGWLVWIAGAAAVGVFIWIGIQMMVGRRNRSQMAADGLSGLPWVVGGLILVATAAGIASMVLKEANASNDLLTKEEMTQCLKDKAQASGEDKDLSSFNC